MSFEPVEDFSVNPGDTPAEIADRMLKAGGFTGRQFAEGVRILRKMFGGESVNILSFPAAIMATGIRGILVQLVRDKKFDLIVTTCGTLDHDIARRFGRYYKGDFAMDDVELSRKGIHRLGNVLIPKESYGPLIEEKLSSLLEKLYSEGVKNLSSVELAWSIGKNLCDESCITYWASKNKIPMVIPGIVDGAVGTQLWLFNNKHRDFNINVLRDEELMAEVIFNSKKLGALMIGGGISKHHTIWWAQFKGGLDYAVYITTAYEYDGSLSGALIREAVSWGKVKPECRRVTIHGDATLILPFLIAASI
jgi:deoxyhypusine synthase